MRKPAQIIPPFGRPVCYNPLPVCNSSTILHYLAAWSGLLFSALLFKHHLMKKSASWSSKIGFILSAAGSAIGLGAIWKFPYTAGTNGGAVFFLLFLLFSGSAVWIWEGGPSPFVPPSETVAAAFLSVLSNLLGNPGRLLQFFCACLIMEGRTEHRLFRGRPGYFPRAFAGGQRRSTL